MLMAKIAAVMAALAAFFAGLFGLSRANQKAATRKVEVESRDILLKRIKEEYNAVQKALEHHRARRDNKLR